jgi:hypothetical protein
MIKFEQRDDGIGSARPLLAANSRWNQDRWAVCEGRGDGTRWKIFTSAIQKDKNRGWGMGWVRAEVMEQDRAF